MKLGYGPIGLGLKVINPFAWKDIGLVLSSEGN